MQAEFLNAVKLGTAQEVERLLSNPKIQAKWIEAALPAAVERGSATIVEVIIQHNRRFLRRVMRQIGRVGNLHLLKRLVKRLDVPSKYLDEAISAAAAYNHPAMVEWALNNTDLDFTKILDEIMGPGNPDIIGLLITSGRINDPRTLLIGAAKIGNLVMVKEALDAGAKDVDEAAVFAARAGQFRVVRYLLNTYPDLDVDAILTSAVQGGDVKTVRTILRRGGEYIDDMFLDAIELGHRDLVRYLISRFPPDKVVLKMAIARINQNQDRLMALMMIRDGYAAFDAFPSITFTVDDIITLLNAGITAFPGYEDEVEEARHVLRQQQALVQSQLPRDLASLSLQYQ